MKTKHLLLGDEALALGALHAGLSGVWAYPGTPSLLGQACHGVHEACGHERVCRRICQ